MALAGFSIRRLGLVVGFFLSAFALGLGLLATTAAADTAVGTPGINAPPLKKAPADERPEFSVGTAFETTFLTDPRYAPNVTRHFDQITPGWQCKPGDAILRNLATAPTPITNTSSYDFSRCDAVFDWAKENNLRVHQHTLVWENPWLPFPQLPAWFYELSSDDAALFLHTYIKTVMQRYGNLKTNAGKKLVVAWDVVSEAGSGWEVVNGQGRGSTDPLQQNPLRNKLPDSYFQNPSPTLQSLGHGPLSNWVEFAFAEARKAVPKAVLYYNDALNSTVPSVDNPLDANYGPTLAIAKQLRSKGLIGRTPFTSPRLMRVQVD